MVATVDVTGNIRTPDDGYMVNANIVFTLTGPMGTLLSQAVAPVEVVAQLGAVGLFNVKLAPNYRGWDNTRYRITVIEYKEPERLNEWRRTDLGLVRITESTDIGKLIPVKRPGEPKSPLVIRKGDSIYFEMHHLNDDGTFKDITSLTITAKMKHVNAGNVITLNVEKTVPAMGSYRVYLNETATLSTGNYIWNVSITDGVTKSSTEYKEIRVQEVLA